MTNNINLPPEEKRENIFQETWASYPLTTNFLFKCANIACESSDKTFRFPYLLTSFPRNTEQIKVASPVVRKLNVNEDFY